MPKDKDDMQSEADALLASIGLPEAGSLAEGIGAMHEIYVSLKAAGFTEFQSLWIVGYIITGGQKPPEEE